MLWASHSCSTCLLLCLAGLLCGRAHRPLICEHCLDPAAMHDDVLLPILNLALVDVHLLAGKAVPGKQGGQSGLQRGQTERSAQVSSTRRQAVVGRSPIRKALMS